MNTFEWSVGLRFLLALALGLLVGLERESTRLEYKKLIFGGVRTFPILSLYGFACAWLFQIGVPFILPAGLASVVVLAAIAYIEKIKTGRLGATSETSALLTFIVGALALLADVRLAMALGVVNTMLLSEKATLETYVERLDKVEFLAVLRFLMVTFIILPVLPNQDFTIYKLNPARIWKIVVMVSAIGFVGYFLTKKFGRRAGLWLSGFLGGIVSSTAVSVAAGRIAQDPQRAAPALQASLLASSVMYLRLLVLLSILAPAFVLAFWWKLAALALAGTVLAGTVVRRGATSATEEEPPAVANPFEIRPALIFAALFVGLTVLTRLVGTRYGGAGVLTLAGLSGLVDVDPFILSAAQQAGGHEILAIRAILVAVMSNTLMKGIYFSTLGRPIRTGALWRYILWALLHIPLIWFI